MLFHRKFGVHQKVGIFLFAFVWILIMKKLGFLDDGPLILWIQFIGEEYDDEYEYVWYSNFQGMG